MVGTSEREIENTQTLHKPTSKSAFRQGPSNGSTIMTGSDGKLPGKRAYAVRRRPVTRKSGFKAHEDATGGELTFATVDQLGLDSANKIAAKFTIPSGKPGSLVGFGLWYQATREVAVTFTGLPQLARLTNTGPAAPAWSKAGSLWQTDGKQVDVEVTFKGPGKVAIYSPGCGYVDHKHLRSARPALLSNMYEFAPEACFYVIEGKAVVSRTSGGGGYPRSIETVKVPLKSCNRCARFLPVNIPAERTQLSFTNHCVAEHRRPCSHAGFGRLRVDSGASEIQLDYGFQLECRFCKKFEVNAAHNPKRTHGQMREDGTRRRGFEFLLAELSQEVPQYLERARTKTELVDDVYRSFGARCFKCNLALTKKTLRLDHTRPLALLWPLDASATALCASCNSQKRDRSPSKFYSKQELRRLSKITGIPLDQLETSRPNEAALMALADKWAWFTEDFLSRPEMAKVREGKQAADLMLKALRKAVSASSTDVQRRFQNKL